MGESKTAEKCRDVSSRLSRPKLRLTTRSGQSDGGQTLAALGATTRQDCTAVLGCHARTETVVAGALQIAGLKGAFHCQLPSDHGSPRGAPLLKRSRILEKAPPQVNFQPAVRCIHPQLRLVCSLLCGGDLLLPARCLASRVRSRAGLSTVYNQNRQDVFKKLVMVMVDVQDIFCG